MAQCNFIKRNLMWDGLACGWAERSVRRLLWHSGERPGGLIGDDSGGGKRGSERNLGVTGLVTWM